MIRIRNDKTINQERAPLKEVLGYESSGSAHGSSFWKRLRGCPREEKLYKIGLRKTHVVNDSLDLGSLYHLALEHYYRAKMEGKSMRDCNQYASLSTITPSMSKITACIEPAGMCPAPSAKVLAT